METPLAYRQFGAEDGRIVVYFHGAPGAPTECALFDQLGKKHCLSFVCFDRFALDRSVTSEAYFRALADAISKKTAGEAVDLAGFSIGAFVALQVCRYLGTSVRRLHLISAAAPLDAGNFLGAMAGNKVFKLARDTPRLFAGLCRGQALLARSSPTALFSLLFASATGQDRVLTAERAFQTQMKEALRACFVKGESGYIRDIEAYVQPWSTLLSDVAMETHIWHGELDNWSPIAMAEYLGSAIPGCVQIEIMKGLSHYSCLHRSAERICLQLVRTRALIE